MKNNIDDIYNFDDTPLKSMSKKERDDQLKDLVKRLQSLAEDAKKDIEIGTHLLNCMYRDEDDILDRYSEGKIQKETMEKEFKLLKENNVTVADMRKKLEEDNELRKSDLREIEQTIKLAKIVLSMDNEVEKWVWI